MGDIPPDPYKALGLTSEATSAAIKTAYKKAALKWHPDKAEDKATAADQFHIIQQAYEILVDDDKRARYDDSIRLSQLRRDLNDRRGSGGPPGPGYSTATPGRAPHVDVRTASYDFRPAPPPSGYFSARGPSRAYDERRAPPSRPHDEDYARYEYADENRASSRKPPAAYEPSPRRPPPRSSKSEDVRRSDKVSPKVRERDRAESKRQKEREKSSGRNAKYAASVASESEDEEVNRFMGGHKGFKDANVERARYDDRRGKGGPSSVQSSDDDPISRKTRSTMEDIRAYINKGAEQSREKRANTSRSPPREYRAAARQQDDEDYEPRRRTPSRERKESKPSRPGGIFRRMSSKQHGDNMTPDRNRPTNKDSSRIRSRTPESPERGSMKAMNSSRSRQQMPKLFTSMSSPSNVKEARSADSRSTRTVDDYSNSRTSTPPRMRRADSLPAESPTPRRPPPTSANSPRASSRQTPTRSSSHMAAAAAERERESTPNVSSNLRTAKTPDHDSGYSTSSESNEPSLAPQPKFTTTSTYHYGDRDHKSAQESSPELAQGNSTSAFREPPIARDNGQNRRFHRSPSPLARASPSASMKNSPHLDSGRESGRESGRDAQRAPPPARSASDTKNLKNPPAPINSLPTSRRPSYSKGEAYTSSSRRTTSSSRKDTGSSKEQSLPLHMKTGSASFNSGLGISTENGTSADSLLFGEMPRTGSPPDMPADNRSRHVSEDANYLGTSAARQARPNREKDSSAPPDGSARRNKSSRGISGNGSRDNVDSQFYDPKVNEARMYMAQQEREATTRPWEQICPTCSNLLSITRTAPSLPSLSRNNPTAQDPIPPPPRRHSSKTNPTRRPTSKPKSKSKSKSRRSNRLPSPDADDENEQANDPEVEDDTEPDTRGTHALSCPTCPYTHPIKEPWYERTHIAHPRSAADDVLGGEDAWRNVDVADIPACPNSAGAGGGGREGGCESKKAYFRQVQIRSADEPMTGFYRCVDCGREWRD
ncbi:MAG: RNA polymerase III C11 subunit [Chrysothrix sp. TS-e1954]|nr:MAG: RNA polymerase III C11 subunit [Chrysothrix sp. TS-e1954]